MSILSSQRPVLHKRWIIEAYKPCNPGNDIYLNHRTNMGILRSELYSALWASYDGMMAQVRDRWPAILRADGKADIQCSLQQLIKGTEELDEPCVELTAAIEVSVEKFSVKLTEHFKTIGRSK